MNAIGKMKYKIGGRIAAQLTPVTGLNETAKHFGVSKNAILQAERFALYKIMTRLREQLEPLGHRCRDGFETDFRK